RAERALRRARSTRPPRRDVARRADRPSLARDVGRRPRLRPEVPRRGHDGRRRGPSAETREHAVSPRSPAQMRPWWARTEGLGPWFRVGADEVRLLRDGAEALPAMLAAIAQAESEVLLEMYWVGPDAVGVKFREALVDRARAGVSVRVIYDAVGSLAI